MAATQNFVELKELEVENLQKGKAVLREDFNYEKIDLRLNEVEVGTDYSVRWNESRHQITEWGFCNLLKLQSQFKKGIFGGVRDELR